MDGARWGARIVPGSGTARVPIARAESVAAAPIDERAGYGYGIASRDVDGGTILGHGGGMVGYLAGLQLDPDAGVGPWSCRTESARTR